MNDINYTLERHIELLKFEQQNKSFFKENTAEYLELSRYNSVVDQHIFWENRFKVGLLMQDFLNRKIDAEELWDSVSGLRRNHIIECNKFLSKLVSEEIKYFSPNKKASKLKGFLSSLYFECEDYIDNIDEYDNGEFYNSIQNGFLKYQEALKEE